METGPLILDKTASHWLFDASNGGIQISADSGAGKSNLMAALMLAAIRLGYPMFLFDPHGDLARLMRSILVRFGDSIRRRLYCITPSDTSVVNPINPAFIDADGVDDHTREARRSMKCSHVARIILYAWGERDFNAKPLLFKWLNRYVKLVSQLGLSLADIRHFLDVGSPIYHGLVRAVPDLMARIELEELADMRPDLREGFIASTKNRLLGCFGNPVVEATLGRTDKRVLNFRQLIQEGAIVLVNLEQGAVLSEEDREIIANLILNELLFAIYTTPEEERVPSFSFFDELPVFSSCAEQITSALRQVRKFKHRFVCAHQGTQFFHEKTEDTLLNALIGQCGTHFYMRHINPVDAKFFAEVLSLPSYDPEKVKNVITQQQQYQDGHEIVTLVDEADNWSEGQQGGGARAEAHAKSKTWSKDESFAFAATESTTDQASTTDATGAAVSKQKTKSQGGTASDSFQHDLRGLRHAVGSANAATFNETDAEGATKSNTHSKTNGHANTAGRTLTETRRRSEGGAENTQITQSENWSFKRQQGGSRTRKQQLVPVIKTREIVTSVEFFTADELNLTVASRMTRLDVGESFMYCAGKPVCLVHVPLIQDPYRRAPKSAAKKWQEFLEELLERPEYHRPDAIFRERQRLLENLLSEVNSLDHRRSPAAIGDAVSDVDDELVIPRNELILANEPADSPFTI